jgi:hypothetical protein
VTPIIQSTDTRETPSVQNHPLGLKSMGPLQSTTQMAALNEVD